MPVHQRPVGPGSLSAQGDLKVRGPVRQDEGDVVAGPDPVGGKKLRYLQAAPVEFGVGDGSPAVRRDDRWRARRSPGDLAEMHRVLPGLAKAARVWSRGPGRRPRTWSAGRP